MVLLYQYTKIKIIYSGLQTDIICLNCLILLESLSNANLANTFTYCRIIKILQAYYEKRLTNWEHLKYECQWDSSLITICFLKDLKLHSSF